jgi:hypothetical protein
MYLSIGGGSRTSYSNTSKHQPLRYRYPEGAGCCVWELAVLWFERQAWVDTVLRHPGRGDFSRYLAARLEGEV